MAASALALESSRAWTTEANTTTFPPMTDPSPQASRLGRAIGCLSFLAFAAAIPLGLFGAFLYWQSDSSEGGGAAGGLAGLGSAAGVVLMAVAAVILVVGGIFYILSAKD